MSYNFRGAGVRQSVLVCCCGVSEQRKKRKPRKRLKTAKVTIDNSFRYSVVSFRQPEQSIIMNLTDLVTD